MCVNIKTINFLVVEGIVLKGIIRKAFFFVGFGDDLLYYKANQQRRNLVSKK